MPFTSRVVSRSVVRWALYIRARPLLAYGRAIWAVFFTTGLRWLVGPETGLPFLTYFPAVTMVGLLGGVGPGAIASLISAILGTRLFAPTYSWGSADPMLMAIVVFLVLCGVKLWVIGLLHGALDELVEQGRNVRRLVEAVPAGIVVAAADGSISLVNASAQSLFGYDRTEILGKSVDILIPANLRSKHQEHRRTYTAQPQVRPMGVGIELSCLRKNGTTFNAEIGLSPLLRGANTSVVATVVDITERRRALERKRFLLRELHHRTQNMFAVIQSIIRRTLEGQSDDADKKKLLLGRIQALAEAQQVLLENMWDGVVCPRHDCNRYISAATLFGAIARRSAGLSDLGRT